MNFYLKWVYTTKTFDIKLVRAYFLLITFLTSSILLNAKKGVEPFEFLIASSDNIVVGEILEVRDTTYLLKVEDMIKGNSDSVIEVKIFREWVCDRRIKPLTIGQRLTLFLNKKENIYNPINGSTGELFIEKGLVSMHVNYPEKIKENDLKKLIIDFTDCYRLDNQSIERPNTILFYQLRSSNDITLKRNKSKLHKWLFDKMQLYNVKLKLEE